MHGARRDQPRPRIFAEHGGEADESRRAEGARIVALEPREPRRGARPSELADLRREQDARLAGKERKGEPGGDLGAGALQALALPDES